MAQDDLARYSRQITLPELGLDGQRRLGESRVLIVGAGGLGSPAALYLGAAGVGRLGIIDDDRVELHNLHRQILHTTADIGRPKAESAADTIRRLNPNVKVNAIVKRVDESVMEGLVDGYDLIVDGSDNYATRYAVNDVCARAGKPWVYGSVERFSGQVALFHAPDGPCYRCLYPEPPAPGTTQSCEEIGVLGAVPGVIGSLQATEALKWLVGISTAGEHPLMQLDLQRGQIRTIRISRNPSCRACGNGSAATRDGAETPFNVEPREYANAMKAGDARLLLDVRERQEWNIARIEGATLLPMSEIQEKVDTLDPKRALVVYCHSGQRSTMVVEWLRRQGFRAQNLAGGIDRWSRDVDPSVPRY